MIIQHAPSGCACAPASLAHPGGRSATAHVFFLCGVQVRSCVERGAGGAYDIEAIVRDARQAAGLRASGSSVLCVTLDADADVTLGQLAGTPGWPAAKAGA